MNVNDPLVTSAYVHLIDGSFPKKMNLVVVTPNATQLTAFRDQLLAKVEVTEKTYSYSNTAIIVGDRTCKFITASTNKLLGMNVDCLFLSDAGKLSSEFLEFVDTFIRPHAIVVQAEDYSSLYSQEIPHK